jgi:hypothetical protein
LTSGVLAAAPASSNVTPGVLGFLVVAAMGVALVFLLRSMNKQFRKITPEAGKPAGTTGTTGTTATGATGSKPAPAGTPGQEPPA